MKKFVNEFGVTIGLLCLLVWIIVLVIARAT